MPNESSVVRPPKGQLGRREVRRLPRRWFTLEVYREGGREEGKTEGHGGYKLRTPIGNNKHYANKRKIKVQL